jgi:hypothetical protein
MPSGIPSRPNADSSPFWFTGLCYSICLSHFAAPVIISPAKTSNAESCGRKIVDNTKKLDKGNRQRRKEEQRLELRLDVSHRSKSVVVGAILFDMATSILHREMDE